MKTVIDKRVLFHYNDLDTGTPHSCLIRNVFETNPMCFLHSASSERVLFIETINPLMITKSQLMCNLSSPSMLCPSQENIYIYKKQNETFFVIKRLRLLKRPFVKFI